MEVPAGCQKPAPIQQASPRLSLPRIHRGTLGVLLLLVTLPRCTPAVYARDVTAFIEGPDRLAVGESAQLIGRLEYSDGSILSTQPSANESLDWTSSDPRVATVVSMSGPQQNRGLVTGLAAGEVVITATPSALTTGTGRRIPGTHRLTVVE